MNKKEYINRIRHLIAKDDLSKAIDALNSLLKNSPRLDEAILQSSRLHSIRQQIRLGLVSLAEANLTQNQIKAGLLDLLSEVDEQSENLEIQNELKHAISLVDSKNVLIDSNLSAGGDIHIGDRNIHTESKTSRRLRLLLYLFVPILSLTIVLLWYLFQPLNLTISLKNRTPNTELPFKEGTVRLTYGGNVDAKTIVTDAIFTGINRQERISLHFESDGFKSIDTSFIWSDEHLVLTIQRDSSLATLIGIITDNSTGLPLEDVDISTPCCVTRTDIYGKFVLRFPSEHQRLKHRLDIHKQGFKPISLFTPVIAGEIVRQSLFKN